MATSTQNTTRIQLKFGDNFKSCNINTNLTPRIIDAIRGIEFEYFLKYGKTYSEDLPDNFEVDGDNGIKITNADERIQVRTKKQNLF